MSRNDTGRRVQEPRSRRRGTGPRERSARVGGLRTRLLELEGEAPAFVLLHGWGDSADCWRPVLSALEEAGVAAVCADVPGHGRADPLGGEPVLEQLDAFTRDLVARQGDAGCIVGGYSLGGLMALRLAQEPPPQLVGVAPMAPPGLERPCWYDAVGLAAPGVRLALSLPAPLPSRLVRRLTHEIYWRTAFSNPERFPAEALTRYSDYWGDRRTAPRQLRAMLDLMDELRDPVDISAIELPTLVMWGRDDHVVSASAARVFAGAAPNTRVELLENCGHIVPLEAPVRVTEHLLRFRGEIGDHARR